jgi:HEAT repeat protein
MIVKAVSAGKNILPIVALLISAIHLSSCSPAQRYIHILNTGDVAARCQAAQDIQALGDRGAPALEALIDAARSQDPELRRFAVEAIGGMGKKAFSGAHTLVRALSDKDVHVRRSAIIAIGNLDKFPTAAFPYFIVCLGDPDSLVREFTMNTFEDLGVAGVGTLARALKDTNVSVRRSAAMTLGRMGPEARYATEALKTAGRDSDIEVSRLAGNALRKITSDNQRNN